MTKLKLYKYRSIDPQKNNDDKKKEIERIISILQGKLYFADWRNCNDPMEGYFEFYGNSQDAQDVHQIIHDKGNLKICALSKTANDILMWSHYANGHQGVCIEIDFDNFNYSEEKDEYFIDEGADSLFIKRIKYTKNIFSILGGDYHKKVAIDILSRKIDKWKYEQEYRAFCKSERGIEKAIGKVTKVITGIRSDDKIINEIKKDSPKNIIFVKAEIDFEKNKIIYNDKKK
ncbi:MAG: DUF2971 domain-containing protein [Snowella sp.]|nr:DUF2971 domain-containing protein [Snowella sp.]